MIFEEWLKTATKRDGTPLSLSSIKHYADGFRIISKEMLENKAIDKPIALFKMDDGTTHFMIGAYSEENKNFYVNHGWGGMVLEQEDVYAWYSITHDLLKEVNSK